MADIKAAQIEVDDKIKKYICQLELKVARVEGLEKLNKDMAAQLLIANCDLVTMNTKFNAAKACIDARKGTATQYMKAYVHYKDICNA